MGEERDAHLVLVVHVRSVGHEQLHDLGVVLDACSEYEGSGAVVLTDQAEKRGMGGHSSAPFPFPRDGGGERDNGGGG